MNIANFSICLILFLGSISAASISAQDAEYELRFEGRWVSPAAVPGSAHFTQLIGATHNADGSVFSPGQQATQGVENVAELGSVGVLTSEINANIALGHADNLILGTDTFITPEEFNTVNFTANASHTRFSLLTMLAPSPDWFVGVNDLDLQNGNGNWRQQIVLDLNSYDAGTEDGAGFSLSNPATNPQDVIQDLDIAETGGVLFGAGSIARLTLTRVDAVPEPGSLIILSGGCLLGCAARQRK